ncbi:MAG: RNA polymerase sigma factor [Planctomycetes bacterium]|nr:RNA polymerase sigma factor [Planctomycetota bacterium]
MTDKQDNIFTDWLDQHLGLIMHIVRAYAIVPEAREDLFQDILLQLWLSIPNFKGNAKETTWIYRVALNTALVWNRQEKRRQKHQTFLDSFKEIDSQNAGNDSIENLEIINKLYIAIRQLPKTESSIILMHLDGLAYQEMAEVLGITASNVGVKLNRAKKSLGRLMKGLIDDL